MGGCLLTESILERHIIRWDRGSHTRHGTFNTRGCNLDSRWPVERSWKCSEAVLIAEFAPANNLTGVSSDLWRMEDEPGASQDDVHRGSLQYQKGDFLFMQITDLEFQRGSLILHVPTS